jgi:ATP synthase protein I
VSKDLRTDAPSKAGRKLPDQIGQKEDRKLRGRRTRDRGTWFWLGMMGLVGWSVSIPTLLGIALGWWADRAYPSRISFTLTGVVLGASLGSLIAWYWIRKESRRE